MPSKTLVDNNQLLRPEGVMPVQSFLTMLCKRNINRWLIAQALPKMAYSECFGDMRTLLNSFCLFWVKKNWKCSDLVEGRCFLQSNLLHLPYSYCSQMYMLNWDDELHITTMERTAVLRQQIVWSSCRHSQMSGEEATQSWNSWNDEEELSRRFSVVSNPFSHRPHHYALKSQNRWPLLAWMSRARCALTRKGRYA